MKASVREPKRAPLPLPAASGCRRGSNCNFARPANRAAGPGDTPAMRAGTDGGGSAAAACGDPRRHYADRIQAYGRQTTDSNPQRRNNARPNCS
jgi:hypothetical protein